MIRRNQSHPEIIEGRQVTPPRPCTPGRHMPRSRPSSSMSMSAVPEKRKKKRPSDALVSPSFVPTGPRWVSPSLQEFLTILLLPQPF